MNIPRRSVGHLLLGVLVPGACFGLATGSDRARRIGIVETASMTPEEMREEIAPLRALGWVEGENLLVERRYWNGALEALQPLVEGLVQARVEVIVAMGPNPTRAAMQATKTIPIVFVAADPVAMGLVTSLSRPTGNVTGFSIAGYEGYTKLMSLLKEMLPALRRIGVLETVGNPQHQASRGRMDAMVRAVGLEPIFLEVAVAGDIEGAVTSLKQQHGQALVLRPDNFVHAHGAELISAALRLGLPTVAGDADSVRKAGALASYSVSDAEVQRRLQYYVDRLLRGARPSELPVEQPTEFELVVNLRTAQTLGISIPRTVLLTATQVVR